MTIAFHDGNIPKESASFPWIKEPKRCALSVCAAFGNITSVYGHIDENGLFVRNGPVRKMAITDKCSEKRLVSVNHQHNDQKFTDKSLENAGLSVKCVLLTDKSSKMKPLSVNSSEILDRLRLRTKNGWVARHPFGKKLHFCYKRSCHLSYLSYFC